MQVHGISVHDAQMGNKYAIATNRNDKKEIKIETHSFNFDETTCISIASNDQQQFDKSLLDYFSKCAYNQTTLVPNLKYVDYSDEEQGTMRKIMTSVANLRSFIASEGRLAEGRTLYIHQDNFRMIEALSSMGFKIIEHDVLEYMDKLILTIDFASHDGHVIGILRDINSPEGLYRYSIIGSEDLLSKQVGVLNIEGDIIKPIKNKRIRNKKLANFI